MSDARHRILDAAETLFGSKGYASTSVREIVNAAGVKAPALYYHFGSKDGLLVELLGTRMDAFFPPLLDRVQQARHICEFFENYAAAIFDSARQKPAVMRFIFGIFTAPRDAIPAAQLLPVQMRYFEPMFAQIERLTPDIDAQRRMFVFAMFDAMIMGSCIQFLAGWAPELPDELASAIASRAAAMVEDELPVPSFPDCQKFDAMVELAQSATSDAG